MGLTELQWGTIFLIAGIAKTLVSLGVGNVVDRLGPKKCMLISFVISAPAMLAFPYSTGFVSTTIIYVALVLGNAFIWKNEEHREARNHVGIMCITHANHLEEKEIITLQPAMYD
ncbi:MAG TPA: hypothetical protein VMW03_00300 [Candidatus Krumholzibacteriaceae bacterium]|nr:hypothetical protein [Candidatus Krumholzibacteriaceae bacterium]